MMAFLWTVFLVVFAAIYPKVAAWIAGVALSLFVVLSWIAGYNPLDVAMNLAANF